MTIPENNYHEKFDRLYNKNFTGRAFNAAEFLDHLTNINFHFEVGELSKLSMEAIDRLKPRFKFYQYGASVAGLDNSSPDYAQAFIKLVARYGKKYGFSNPKQPDGQL